MARWKWLGAALLLNAVGHVCAGGPWDPASFPNPKTDVDLCGRGGKPSSICDPDGVLSREGQDRVEGVIIEIAEGSDPYARAPCGAEGLEGYKVAVALMRSMAVPGGESPAAQAAVFARQLHDAWGVGDAACNNGVLLLLALEQRQVYISTGRGAAAALSDARIAGVVDAMRPLLRKGAYDEAVEQAVVDIGLGLAGRETEGEGAVDWFAVTFFGVVALLVFNSCRRSFLRRREYRDCKRMLAKLKKEQERVRNHAWSAPASCPICLEDFNPPPAARKGAPAADVAPAGAADEAGPSGSRGSAGASLEADGDSPSTSTAADAAAAAAAAEAQPFLARGSLGLEGGSDGESCSRGGAGGAGGGVGVRRRSVGKGLNDEGGAAGGDGDAGKAPRRVAITLACGHTFCDPCLTTWLQQKTTCPICRDRVTDSSPPPARDGPQPGSGSGAEAGAGQANRLLLGDLWAMELAFRLGSLQRMYPGYVSPTMADQWVVEARQTGTFNWEATREFQLRDPGVRAQHESHGGGGFSSGFGGGSSYGGGGGGGSW